MFHVGVPSVKVRLTDGTGDGILVVVGGEHVADVAARAVPGVHVRALLQEHDVVAQLEARQRADTLAAILVDLEGPVALFLFLKLLLDLGFTSGCGMKSSLRRSVKISRKVELKGPLTVTIKPRTCIRYWHPVCHYVPNHSYLRYRFYQTICLGTLSKIIWLACSHMKGG